MDKRRWGWMNLEGPDLQIATKGCGNGAEGRILHPATATTSSLSWAGSGDSASSEKVTGDRHP